MVQINDNYYEDLDEDNFVELLIKLKKGIPVVTGSQVNRQCSEPLRKKSNA